MTNVPITPHILNTVMLISTVIGPTNATILRIASVSLIKGKLLPNNNFLSLACHFHVPSA